jgi:TPR repeat protein
LVTIVVAILILGWLAVSAWKFRSSLFAGNRSPVTEEVLAAGYGIDHSVSGITKRAEAGDGSAQLALADMYERGVSVKQDPAEAAKWLRMSAENGNPTAAYKLGGLFEKGYGVPRSRVDAYTWYILASAKGNKPSDQAVRRLTPQLSQQDIAKVRLALGRFYAEGIAVPRDYVAAYFWFVVAEAAGSRDAERERLKIVPKMVERQIIEARTRASKWLKAHAADTNPPNKQSITDQTSSGSNQFPVRLSPMVVSYPS